MKPTSTRNQYLATFIATSTVFSAGMAFTWSSPVESQIVADENGACSRDFCVSSSEFAWITSCVGIGQLGFGFLGGPLMAKFGRKIALMIFWVPMLGGWLSVTFAQASWMLFLGRLLIGVGAGGAGVVTPIYICEIADAMIRGRLMAFFQTSLTVGLMLTYVLGYFLSMFPQGLISTIVVAVYGCALVFIPETPMYHISKNDNAKATKSIVWLRGPQSDFESEIQEVSEFQKNLPPANVRMLFSDKTQRRGLIVMAVLIIGFQLSGINAILSYTAGILADADINIDPNLAAISVGAFSLAAVFLASLIVDRVGRKILLLISYPFMSTCFVVLGIYFQLQQSNPENVKGFEVLPVIILCLFNFTSSIGAAPVTWMLMGEMFSNHVKDAAASICMTLNFTFSIVVTLLFPYLRDSLGSGVTFYIFSAFNVGTFVWVIFMVKETKRQTLVDIQKMLKTMHE